jgi:hypothetical protein
MTHAKDKLCDFIRYNVQYVMFIVAHIRNWKLLYMFYIYMYYLIINT